jgi:hypothetical protein
MPTVQPCPPQRRSLWQQASWDLHRINGSERLNI